MLLTKKVFSYLNPDMIPKLTVKWDPDPNEMILDPHHCSAQRTVGTYQKNSTEMDKKN